MKRGKFIGCNFKHARNLSNEQLRKADTLRGSILPDGSRYDGRFNLPGDRAY